ncbi:hypothetical protein [Ekhidna sp.]|uniref:hypothetical protein n=1 Tax=Ekhidna sp. TaxID=2608089 RepID=UPI003C7EC87D
MDISISTHGSGDSNAFMEVLFHLAPALIAAFVALFTFMVKNYFDTRRERSYNVNQSILKCLELANLRLMKAKALGRVHLSTEVTIRHMDKHKSNTDDYKLYLDQYNMYRKNYQELQSEMTDLSSQLITHAMNLTLKARLNDNQRDELIRIIDNINHTEFYYYDKIIIENETYRIDKMSDDLFDNYINNQNDQLERISDEIKNDIVKQRLELRDFFKQVKS